MTPRHWWAPDFFEKREVTYTETYTLFKLNKEKTADIGLADEAYMVEMSCPSTGKKYYEFVDPSDEEFGSIITKDAIAAIAWTMYLTKEEYLDGETLVSET